MRFRQRQLGSLSIYMNYNATPIVRALKVARMKKGQHCLSSAAATLVEGGI